MYTITHHNMTYVTLLFKHPCMDLLLPDFFCHNVHNQSSDEIT